MGVAQMSRPNVEIITHHTDQSSGELPVRKPRMQISSFGEKNKSSVTVSLNRMVSRKAIASEHSGAARRTHSIMLFSTRF